MAYDPIGAMGGLFAPAYIPGNAESIAAVAAWNAAHLKRRPAKDVYTPPTTLTTTGDPVRDAIASVIVANNAAPIGADAGGMGLGAPPGDTSNSNAIGGDIATSPSTPGHDTQVSGPPSLEGAPGWEVSPESNPNAPPSSNPSTTVTAPAATPATDPPAAVASPAAPAAPGATPGAATPGATPGAATPGGVTAPGLTGNTSSLTGPSLAMNADMLAAQAISNAVPRGGDPQTTNAPQAPAPQAAPNTDSRGMTPAQATAERGGLMSLGDVMSALGLTSGPSQASPGLETGPASVGAPGTGFGGPGPGVQGLEGFGGPEGFGLGFGGDMSNGGIGPAGALGPGTGMGLGGATEGALGGPGNAAGMDFGGNQAAVDTAMGYGGTDLGATAPGGFGGAPAGVDVSTSDLGGLGGLGEGAGW